MTVVPLYERYKALTLATTAALILERPVDELGVTAQALLEDSRVEAPGACADAARDLSELLRLASLGESTEAQLETVRASHLRLRRQVWSVHSCEYVPCCVSEMHHH